VEIFIYLIYLGVQRGVSIAHCGYTLCWSIQSLPLLSLTPLSPTPHFSTSFNTYPFILYLHVHHVCDYSTVYSSTLLGDFFSNFYYCIQPWANSPYACSVSSLAFLVIGQVHNSAGLLKILSTPCNAPCMDPVLCINCFISSSVQ
jgi:hypothetical protein